MTLKTVSKTENGKIYESASFRDGLYFLEKEKYKGKRKLGLLDLDNTILSYRHTLGTDQWFDFDFAEFMRKGKTAQEAKDLLLPGYLDVVRKIHPDDIYAVEESTPEHIRVMQRNGIETLILTSRGSLLLTETQEHLSRFGMNFNQGSFKGKTKKLPLGDEGLFIEGMILTGGQHKGKCLFTCLEDVEQMPEVILMWDDKLSNLEKVRASIEEYNAKKKQECEQAQKPFTPIKFIGIRYSKLDHIINNVRPDVVALQKQYFARVLSDEHARAILKAEGKKGRKPSVDVDFQPQNDCVVVSVTKGEVYRLLKNLEPAIDKNRILGKEKEIGGKLKLPWQFQFTVSEFEPLFHKLSQHGLIEGSQFDALSQVFTKTSPLIARMYELHLAKPVSDTAAPGVPLSEMAPVLLPSEQVSPQIRPAGVSAALARK